MRHIFALFLLVALSASAADTPVAVVRGTNVLGTAIVDIARFTPPAGASNVVITTEEVGIYRKGCRYLNGVFYNPDGSPIANGQKAIVDRANLINAAISDMGILQSNTVKATWDAMATSNKLEVVRIGLSRLGTLMEKLLIEKRKELFELQEAE